MIAVLGRALMVSALTRCSAKVIISISRMSIMEESMIKFLRRGPNGEEFLLRLEL